MDLNDFQVKLCKRNDIVKFIEKNHYSKSVNGVKSNFCFKLVYNNTIIGAIMFGEIAMKDVWKKYVDDENKIIELRRLCCIDDTPKNTESYFISKCIRWLKNNTHIEKIISYADNEYNHTGIIYQASHFKFLGETLSSKVIIYNNKIYHDKTIRTTFNGKLKPFAKKIKDALELGTAKYHITKTKNIYLYDLKSVRKKKIKDIINYSNSEIYLERQICNNLDNF